MKKWCLFLGVCLCLYLLAACGAAQSGPVETGDPPPEPVRAVITCRAVTVENSQVLLAGVDDDPNIYTASLKDTSGIQPGALVEVTYDGNILETWPAQFSGVTAVETVEGGLDDDRCALYLQVLEDLWEVDSGLNGDLTYIGVDLSETSLSDSERSAVAWAFAGKHSAELVTGTWEELADQGYINRENLYWEDGVLFSITEKAEPVYFMPEGMTAVTFDAEKWRSGLGAYFFFDCTSTRDADGHWDGYTVGSEAIS